MVQTHFQYCIICWGKACNNSLDPLIKLQKRIIRAMTFSNRLTPSLPLFHKLQLLKLEYIYKLEICKEMHKIQTKSTNQLSKLLKFNSSIHNHTTRNSSKNNFFIKITATEKGKQSLTFICPLLCQKVPYDIKKNWFLLIQTQIQIPLIRRI